MTALRRSPGDHYNNLDTFAAACRAADAKRAAELRKRPDDHLDFLRHLAELDVSPERFSLEVYRRHFAGRAAASTVEALMLGLRWRGLAALREAPVQQRLSQLSEAQLHEVCARLQKLKPEIARAWPADEVKLLLEAWAICHGR